MKLYKFKLFLLVLLGYAYIFSVLALLVALVALLFYTILTGKGLNTFIIQFEIAFVIVTTVVFRSLWVRLQPPEGLKLSELEQPQLFEMLHQIRRAVGGPRVHAVLLTEELHASAVSIPRLGLLGWPRHYLLIGLPLMHVLSPAEFRATIAHELGHLAGAHGRFSSWIYRINSTWYRLMCELTGRREWASKLFNRFFAWYVPYLRSYSVTLLRTHEFEADRRAAEAASAEAIAGVLVRLAVFRPYVQEFWCDLQQLDKSVSSPPPAVTKLLEALRGGVPEDDAKRWLDQVLGAEASEGDSYPSLGMRLEALGIQAKLPESIAETAAEFYLADDLPRLIHELDETYRERVREDWEESYQEFHAATNELSELDRQAAERELTVEEAYQRACLTEEFGNKESALALYRRVVERNPDHAPASFNLGRMLLSEKQDEGIQFLERAMELNASYVYVGCNMLYGYFAESSSANSRIAAQNYLRRAAAQSQVEQNAHAERNEVSFLDDLTTHDLSHEKVDQLRRELAQDSQVREAYLVRKRVKYLPDKPLYALGVVVDRPWYKQIRRYWSYTKQFAYPLKSPANSATQTSLIASSPLPSFELYSFELAGHDKRLRARFRKVDNSLIYERA